MAAEHVPSTQEFEQEVQDLARDALQADGNEPIVKEVREFTKVERHRVVATYRRGSKSSRRSSRSAEAAQDADADTAVQQPPTVVHYEVTIEGQPERENSGMKVVEVQPLSQEPIVEVPSDEEQPPAPEPARRTTWYAFC